MAPQGKPHSILVRLARLGLLPTLFLGTMALAWNGYFTLGVKARGMELQMVGEASSSGRASRLLLPLMSKEGALLDWSSTEGHSIPPPSSHKCVEQNTTADGPRQRLCTVSDVWLLNGTLYYVTSPPGPANLSAFDAWGASGADGGVGRGLLRDADFTCVTGEELARLAEGVESDHIEEVLFWTAGEAGVLRRQEYFGVMLGMLPALHATLRQYRGMLTGGMEVGSGYQEQIQPIELLQRRTRLAEDPQGGSSSSGSVGLQHGSWFPPALRCLTATPSKQAWRMRKATRIGTGVVGPGAGGACGGGSGGGGAGACAGELSSAAAQERLADWRQALGACLGFDATAPARTSPPSIVVFNNHYHQGPQIENGYTLAEELRRKYGRYANVSYRSPAGLGLRQQAALWAGASIAVHLHSEQALANWLLLPHGAAAVQLLARPRPGAGQELALGKQMEAVLRGVNNVRRVTLPNPDPAAAHLRLEELAEDPLWRNLTSEQKVAILERADCSLLPVDVQEEPCGRRWLSASLNLVSEPRLLLAAVGRALEQVHARAGRALPAKLAALAGVKDVELEK